jgi:hypothetical protein
VSDRHSRVLRVVARHRKRRLDDQRAATAVPDTGSADRRDDLERTAARTRARVAAAATKRRKPSQT